MSSLFETHVVDWIRAWQTFCSPGRKKKIPLFTDYFSLFFSFFRVNTTCPRMTPLWQTSLHVCSCWLCISLNFVLFGLRVLMPLARFLQSSRSANLFFFSCFLFLLWFIFVFTERERATWSCKSGFYLFRCLYWKECGEIQSWNSRKACFPILYNFQKN